MSFRNDVHNIPESDQSSESGEEIDLDEGNSDVEPEPVECFFCRHVEPSVQGLLAHCLDAHKFDLQGVIQAIGKLALSWPHLSHISLRSGQHNQS